MRDKLIDKIHELGTRVFGFEFMFHKLHEMSNDQLLELYVEMRIEEHDDLLLTNVRGIIENESN